MTSTAPMENPDDKDWTWVLETTCDECQYDVRGFARAQIGPMIRENASAWNQILGREPGQLAIRPRPDRWSPLEYACHVRDVYELYDQRLTLMLTQDGPSYPNWDQDITAVEKNYAADDPAVVAAELLAEAERLASRFDNVEDDEWERAGYRSDGAAFTIESFARYLIHDPVHHLWDVNHA
ncbi:MAG: DinB family protein [Actinomycetota bacterium]|nr:DinB family protein [Actinomycetota bacterium]